MKPIIGIKHDFNGPIQTVAGMQRHKIGQHDNHEMRLGGVS
jgi:hypothetical protein